MEGLVSCIYVNELSYQQVKDKYTKNIIICVLFTNPNSNNSLLDTTKTFPIHWRTHARMRSWFLDRWHMVFDPTPCNNYEVPLLYLRKLYCEFILDEKLNYFDIHEFHGRESRCAR